MTWSLHDKLNDSGTVYRIVSEQDEAIMCLMSLDRDFQNCENFANFVRTLKKIKSEGASIPAIEKYGKIEIKGNQATLISELDGGSTLIRESLVYHAGNQIEGDGMSSDIFIIIEYVHGKNVFKESKDVFGEKEDLSSLVNFVLLVVRDVLETLVHFHNNNMIHQDVRPENIIYDKRKNVLIDFGLTRRSGPLCTSCNTAFSPYNRKLEHHESWDLYALGWTAVVLLLRLEENYNMNNRDALRNDLWSSEINERVRRFCIKAVNESETKRYTSAELMLADVNKIIRRIKIANHRGIIILSTVMMIALFVIAFFVFGPYYTNYYYMSETSGQEELPVYDSNRDEDMPSSGRVDSEAGTFEEMEGVDRKKVESVHETNTEDLTTYEQETFIVILEPKEIVTESRVNIRGEGLPGDTVLVLIAPVTGDETFYSQGYAVCRQNSGVWELFAHFGDSFTNEDGMSFKIVAIAGAENIEKARKGTTLSTVPIGRAVTSEIVQWSKKESH